MIPVTRLDGTAVIINADQIAWIECHPDTVISLMNGEKLIVRERPDTVVDRVRAFKRITVLDRRRHSRAVLSLATSHEDASS
jgi:flagellar protein FlbD